MLDAHNLLYDIININIYSTFPGTDFLHLKIGRVPKGNEHLPTIHFQEQTVCFREVT